MFLFFTILKFHFFYQSDVFLHISYAIKKNLVLFFIGKKKNTFLCFLVDFIF